MLLYFCADSWCDVLLDYVTVLAFRVWSKKINEIMYTRNFSRLRRLSFLFMGNMSPYYFKTIFRLCMKCMPSFIKIGGAVSEKNGKTRHTFVVLYIGCRKGHRQELHLCLLKGIIKRSHLFFHQFLCWELAYAAWSRAGSTIGSVGCFSA